jgi:hypothetical protein
MVLKEHWLPRGGKADAWDVLTVVFERRRDDKLCAFRDIVCYALVLAVCQLSALQYRFIERLKEILTTMMSYQQVRNPLLQVLGYLLDDQLALVRRRISNHDSIHHTSNRSCICGCIVKRKMDETR